VGNEDKKAEFYRLLRGEIMKEEEGHLSFKR
jgi:hypothetical protein